MDELTDYSSTIVEFKASLPLGKQNKLVDSSIGTDPLPTSKDVSVETNQKCNVVTQTQSVAATDVHVDEKKLALWLRKVYPAVEAELLKGPTPVVDNYAVNNSAHFAEEMNIQTYQKISMDSSLENSQGLATWLAVHTNNAPVLVVTVVAPHDDWCEHTNQTMKLFIPKRMPTSNIVVFTEAKSVPVRACFKSLCTNAFNKSIFAGSTLDGDIYVWQYECRSNAGDIEVKELFNFTCPQGYAVAMDWAAENRLLTCHSNGLVVQWLIGKQMLKEGEYAITPTPNTTCEITTLICLGVNEFVVGAKDGGVYHCWNSSVGVMNKKPDITLLRRHLFMVSTLLKTQMAGFTIVISCDLSGQVYYHDIRNADDDSANVIMQIPLPFKNAIACSHGGNTIYCPGLDGSLECYRIRDGVHSIIKGALRGKGNLIKCSGNGCWIITGLYEDAFQIFYTEN